MDKEFSLNKDLYLNTIEYIKDKHAGQFRRFSMCPYYVHPIRVATLVMKYKESHKIDELILAALLHDVVEDTKTTLYEIEERYGKLVASLVEELSSDKQLQHKYGKTIYLSQKMHHMSTWGLVVKLCDRYDNIMDFAYASNNFIRKYGKETIDIMQYLTDNRKLTNTHIHIMNDIWKMLDLYKDQIIYE